MSNQSPLIADLLNFLDNSPVNFAAVDQCVLRLEKAGFKPLDPAEKWHLSPSGRYYVVKNGSAIVAFSVPSTGMPGAGCHIIAAHSDSPGFRIKPNSAMWREDGAVKLNTEVYGGPILYTWFDRPLSLAGRVILRGKSALHPISRTVVIRRPMLTVPHLAIHFNRAVNEGNPLSKQKDMLPLIGYVNSQSEATRIIPELLQQHLGVNPQDILDFDLSLYDSTPACTFGVGDNLLSSGRIDDLSMVHAAVTSLIEASATPSGHIRVAAIFDNEETGSGTKQGAASPWLKNILMRINDCLGGDGEAFHRSVAGSFLISADNAHALHPNHPEKHDPTNHPCLGGGPVIKYNANCKYMTDADSAAVFMALCDQAGVRYQTFVNHSDVAGGSTLGNILTSQLDIRGVDMGAPILAMHSVRETASVADHISIAKVFTGFFTL